MTFPPDAPTELDQILVRCLTPPPAAWLESGESGLAAAAVLVPLVVDDNGIDVILTVRAAHLRHHSGQISLPGGRRETQDRDPVATALRECEEEIGLESEAVKVVGGLKPLATGTGFLISPVVGLVSGISSIRPREPEVAAVFRVPLGFLMEPSNRHRRHGVHNGRLREYFEILFRSHRIWGATAAVLIDLCDRLIGKTDDVSEVKYLSREIAKFRKMVHDQPLKVERPWGPQ
jgi:8-oxo-dGTP pyrophosphatase MutT (NUDIX family)